MEQRSVLSPGGSSGQPRSNALTAEEVVRRLAAAAHGLRRSPDLSPESPPRGDHDLNDRDMYPALPLVSAAVLLPIVTHPAGLSVLFTLRTPHLSAHAGQVSFPAVSTGTPAASLCLDASNNIIKKTTAGSCI